MCAACPTPPLKQSYELRPPWEQHLRYVPHRVRNGHNIMTIFVSCHFHNYLFTKINTKKQRVVQLYILVSGAKLDHLGSDTACVSHVPLYLSSDNTICMWYLLQRRSEKEGRNTAASVV